MPSLGSLLLDAHLATLRQVEDATFRQMLYGDDLSTHLLDLGLGEAALVRGLAEAHEVEALEPGELPRGSREALDMVPLDVAERHRLYPLALQDGVLEVVVADPLPEAVGEALAAKLGVGLRFRFAALPRIRQALARDYRATLPPHLERLIEVLDASLPVKEAPPAEPATEPAEAVETAEPAPSAAEASVETTETAQTAGAAPFDVDPTPPTAEVASAETTPPPAAPPAESADAAPKAAPISEPPPTPKVPRVADARDDDTPSSPRRPRRLGPITPAIAKEALEDAGNRDEVLSAFFDFARQFFECSALFVVQRTAAEIFAMDGSDGAVDLSIPLDASGKLSDAKNRKLPIAAALADEGEDQKLREGLGRKTKASVLVLPIIVRDRTVALLYGDRGDDGVELATVGEVLALAPLCGQALERIILRKKLGRA